MRLATPCLVTIALVAITGTVASQNPPPFIPDFPQTLSPDSIPLPLPSVDFARYVHDLARPSWFAGMIGGSVMDQIRHTQHGPPELEDRIEERASHRAVVVTVRDGMSALLHISPSRYQFCRCSGFRRKVGHALLESFTARRTDGSRTLAIPRFASAYAGSLTSLAWHPDRSAGQVLLGTTLDLGVNALVNVAKELAPAWHVRLPIVHDVVIPFAK
jgi:hypothetical protein